MEGERQGPRLGAAEMAHALARGFDLPREGTAAFCPPERGNGEQSLAGAGSHTAQGLAGTQHRRQVAS